jgi:hypothetical protein
VASVYSLRPPKTTEQASLYLMWPLYMLIYVQSAWGVLRNATIDDQFGDLRTGLPAIIYQPIQKWHFGPSCGVCTIKLDSQQTSNGSWHDSTSYSPTDVKNITLSFNGAALIHFFDYFPC